MDMVQDLKPRNIGPGGMSGRITAIDVVHQQPDRMFVGTASGGVWKSTSGGIQWEPIFDTEVTASVGAIAIQQSNPSVIWVGTGEGNPRNSLNGGFGIYKSIDGGENWVEISGGESGFPDTEGTGRIGLDISRSNSNILFAILDNQDRREGSNNAENDDLTKDDLRSISTSDFLKINL